MEHPRFPSPPPHARGGLAQFFVEHRALGWVAMAAVLLGGWFAFHSLPQQEDPTFPRHDALVVTLFPGATARQVEDLVTRKLQTSLSAYDAVGELRSQSRANVSVIYVMLRSYRKEQIALDWDELRGRLSKIPLPEGCAPPRVDTDYQATATLLIALASPCDANLELERAAELLEADLQEIPSVSRVRLFGNAPQLVELQAGGTRLPGPEIGPGAIPYTVEVLYRGPGETLATERSVLAAVEMKEGSIIGQFDRAVRAAVSRVQLPEDVSVHIVSDQPAATSRRIGQFITCFNEAVVVVVLVCLFLMDWRTALVVAIAIPLTLALTLAGMALLGVPLHQISIAALIIALGMLVDDPVVAADGINRELADGQPRGIAAWLGPYRLRRAILFGTIINILAFLPLALLPGDMGSFIIALPIVITLALVASRIVSVTFVPLLGYHLLRGQRGFEAGGEIRRLWPFRPVDRFFLSLLPRYRSLLRWGLDHPAWTVTIAYGLLVASGGLTRHFDHRFFPAAERHQCLIDIQLPPDADLTETRMVCDRIAAILQSQESIVNAAVFCGGTAPNFYYNVLPRPPAANVAQVLINTRDAQDVPGLVVKLRAEIDREPFHASCIVRQLDQGPALEAPIMVRLTGIDLEILRQQAGAVAEVLRDSGGYKVSDDLGAPVTMGKLVGNGESPDYAVISHSAGQRAVTVKAYSTFDQLPSRVLERARETIDNLALPPGYTLEYAGEERELKNSRREMQRVMLISLALIALAMVIQFRSILKSLVVMLTVPLGLVGAFVGLAVTHASFGFMALLGLVSLAGVIVSHIIVLSDFIEEARSSGMELKEALMQAGLVRLRAVMVTVLATVCGLIPLALQGGALWRPLTAVHIFGLLLATALTLLVLPVWYYLFAARLRWI